MIKNLINSIPFIQSYFSGMATIFMLHRVYPFEHGKLSPNENMKISPEFLERFIVELKSKGYDFISLDELHKILQNKIKIKKKIIFTLDDGYLDNYTKAYPIFKKYNIPFTIYITTAFAEGKAILWWYTIEDLIIANDWIELGNGRSFQCKTKKEKEELFFYIRSIILGFKKDNFLESLNKLFCKYDIDWFGKAKELGMTWQHIIEISKNELCTIGNHTKNHYALNKLSKEEVISEIIEANTLIEEKIGKKVEHFAYPFGSRFEVGQREVDIAKELGFKMAVTTRSGTVYMEHKDYLYCLPRIMLYEDFDIKTVGNLRRKRIVTL